MKAVSQKEIDRLLSIEDLSKKEGHCIKLLVDKIHAALAAAFEIQPKIIEAERITSPANNFYKLGYDRQEITLSSTYTKYLEEDEGYSLRNSMFRTQMTSAIPPLLEEISSINADSFKELYLIPGIVFRRDVIDRTHVGEPHQMDVWLIRKGEETNRNDLLFLVNTIVEVVSELLGRKVEFRYNETSHHYTDGGIEVEILFNDRWLEILECGLAGRKLLTNSGLSKEYSGLALGMGLDRLCMIIKEIPDIRILRSENPKIKKQMFDLNKYKPVSNQPSTSRDFSICVDNIKSFESLTEDILNLSVSNAECIEEIKLISETDYFDLHKNAIDRLGAMPFQKNVLFKVVLRHLSRPISKEESSAFYNLIYKEIHEGTKGYYESNNS